MRRTPTFVRPQTPPNADINVTPLVDVVLVLLIIFMVVTPLLEKDLEVRVPEKETVVIPEAIPPNPLVVQVDVEGRYRINTELIAPGDYVDRLSRMLAAKAREDRVVFFQADDAANYGKLITALDGAKEAGAVVLGMATQEAPPGPAGASPSPPTP